MKQICPMWNISHVKQEHHMKPVSPCFVKCMSHVKHVSNKKCYSCETGISHVNVSNVKQVAYVIWNVSQWNTCETCFIVHVIIKYHKIYNYTNIVKIKPHVEVCWCFFAWANSLKRSRSDRIILYYNNEALHHMLPSLIMFVKVSAIQSGVI